MSNRVLQEGNVRGHSLTMSNEKSKTLNDINDILIVKKIKETDPTNVTSNVNAIEATQCLCFSCGCDCERNLLAEEQEAIIKKQLQMLQADERGKQALISEIAALKQRQEQRAELIRNRQRALDIEKERSRKIASLPPPLPKSVKLLLRKTDDEPKTSKPDVQMPNELTAITIKPIEPCYENKENILDPKELEAKQKMQEKWQMKAKKRFNEALKKDRQKEEYTNIMKQIQNAELLNRREMAKNISSDKKGIPCPLSDKFQIAKKQADMEEAAEKLFKKTGTKEHVIEDIEGYQDHYEEKYKKIDSNYEAKMIDCVPSFVKENYEYLLEDESKFLGGRNFSGLDDSSSDILNQAYIETPPGIDELDGSGKIDLAISHLDKIRSNLQEEYEQTFKPLLMAAIEIPKKELSDKAVETESIKVPAEDKAVETDEQFKEKLSSPSPAPIFDYKSSGVMAYKRRPHGPILSNYQEMYVPDIHQRDVHYTVPSVTQSQDLAAGSWSSSSYCSLPSKHGIPTFPGASGSMKCDICVAEMEKDLIKDDFPHELPPVTTIITKGKSAKSTDSTKKTPFSERVQQLAKKYLVTKSASSYTPEEGTIKAFSDSCLPIHSNTETMSPAFEKEVIGRSKAGVFVELQKSEESIPVSEKSVVPQEKKIFHSPLLIVEKPAQVTRTGQNIIPDSAETSVKTSDFLKDSVEKGHLQNDVYSKIKSVISPKSPVEYSDYDLEAKRIQAIHQVLSRRIPRFTLDSSPEPEKSKDEKETEKSSLSVQNGMGVKPHVYHELSTIQELDSALTAGSFQFSQSKLSDTSGVKAEREVPSQEGSKEDLVQSEERLKMVSLLDSPDSQISELAKSIHFVPETEEEANHPVETAKAVSLEHFNVISVSSKEDFSMPSHISSSDSNSISSFSSGAKVFSSTLTGNQVKYPYLKDVKSLPHYFKDVSNVQKKVSGSEKSDSYSSIPPSEFLSSTPISSYSQSIPSVVDVKSKENKDTQHSIISGYISDLEVPEMTKSDIPHPSQEKSDVHSIISGYISDLEVPEMTKTDTSHPSQEQKDNMHSIISGYISNIETPNVSDSAAFHPMTPRSGISSPGIYSNTAELALKFHEKINKVLSKDSVLKHDQPLIQSSLSDRSLKPMTPQSDISSPSELASLASKYKHQGLTTSAESFKALTPRYDISSPGESVFNTSKYEYQGFRSTESFKALTPRYDISSPGESVFHASEHGHQGFRSTESFKALTPRSDISSPSELVVLPPKTEHQGHTSSSGSFKALTPKSMISSPSSSDEVELRRKVSSESPEFHPLTLRLDISTNSLLSNSATSKPLLVNNPLQLSCNLALKTHLSIPTNLALPPKVSGQEAITGATDERIHHLNEFKSNVQMTQKGLHKIEKKIARICSSGYFDPCINEDLTSSKEKNNQCNVVKGTLTTEYDEDDDKQKLAFDSKMTASIGGCEKQEKLPEQKQSTSTESIIIGIESTSSVEKILAGTTKEKLLTAKSKEFSEQQNLCVLEMTRGFGKQYSNLQAVSSTSSSTENLSEISSSKVLYQSTPVKSLSEIIQEPGIMEEPDLTLVTTNLSCKVGSPEMPRDPSTSSPFKNSTNEEKDCTFTSQNECKTPSFQGPQLLGSADTPSMLSFLHHEMSCMQTENDEISSPAKDINVVPGISESKTPYHKEVKGSLFPRTDYKQRTKRLWNNLEEVKKKNSVEERKRLMEINRKKAKEYAKKLTPKQKGK